MRHLLVPFLVTAAVAAQTPSFDVISVKPNKSGSGSMTVAGRGGDRWVAVNATPLVLVMNAYRHETFNVIAVPDWMKAERYDVTATSSLINPTREQYPFYGESVVGRPLQAGHPYRSAGASSLQVGEGKQ